MTTHRSLERLIEDQIGTWSMEHGKDPRADRTHFPVITISRTFGARGAALGRRLANRTGFALWDRELVQAIAEEAGGEERIMESLDERRRALIDETVRRLIVGDDATNARYYRSLIRIIRTISHHGSAVIVGRGANFVVRPERALRVRVTAPVGWRIKGVAERNRLSMQEAETLVLGKDRERADFTSYYFKQAIESPEHYDLVLNASRFTLDHMAELILHAYADCFNKFPVGTHAVPA